VRGGVKDERRPSGKRGAVRGGRNAELGGLAQNSVDLGVADRADALGHATSVLFDNDASEVALFLALHAVRRSCVALVCHGFLLGC